MKKAAVDPGYWKTATWLTLLNNRKHDGRIELIGENTQPYHGDRTYFEGHYLRVSLLSGKAREKVVEEATQGGIHEWNTAQSGRIRRQARRRGIIGLPEIFRRARERQPPGRLTSANGYPTSTSFGLG